MNTELSEVGNGNDTRLAVSAGAIRVRVQPDTDVTSAPSRIVIAPVLDFGPVVLGMRAVTQATDSQVQKLPVAGA